MSDTLIFRNTLFQLLTKVLTASSTLVLTIIIARTLGVAGYGEFTKIVTFVALFYMIVDFGLNAVFLQEKKSTSFTSLLLTRICFATLFFIVANGIVWILPYTAGGGGFPMQVKWSILLFSATLFTQSVIVSSAAIFQYKQSYEKLFIATLAGSVITVGLVFGLMYVYLFSLPFVLGSMIGGSVVTAGLTFLLAGEKVYLHDFKKENAIILIKKSLPLGLMLLFNLVYFRADVILLSFYKPSFDVGIYGLSYRFFDFLVALPLFLSNSLYPLFLENAKNNRIFMFLIKKYLLLASIIAIIIIVLFWVISPLFVFIEPDFSYAILPFRLLLLSLPIFFFTSILQWGIIAKKQQTFLVIIYAFVGIVNIVLNLLFIPQYSYVASAIITGVGECVVLVVLASKLWIFSKNTENGITNN